MAHEFESPPALDALLTRLDELAVVVGPSGAPRLGAVREALASALAQRARGDVPGAVRLITRAMQELAALADGVDATEAALMRSLVQVFGAAIGRGERGELTRAAEVMRERSGATKVEKR